MSDDAPTSYPNEVYYNKHKETGLSRGSAFLKFQEAEHAEAAVLAGNNMPAASEGKSSALHRGPIYVNGKPTRIDLALERDQAKRLDESKSTRGTIGRTDGGKDKRNLYLSNEGLGVGSTLLEDDMPEADKEKRKRAHQEKRKKLQNPLFFVSATRLCVRNLKKAMTDSDFRDLCIKATKEGLKNGKVSAGDIDTQLAAQGLSIKERPAEALVVPTFSAPCPGAGKGSYLKNLKAKIMRDTSRLKAGTDIAQSRGYGFVEFQHHGHALACLRQLNNNPDYWQYSMSHANQDPTKRPRLIVEFSLEDTRKVNMLKKRTEKVLSKKQPSSEIPPEVPAGKSARTKKRERKGDKKSENMPPQSLNEKNKENVDKEDKLTSVNTEQKVTSATASNNTKINNKRLNKEALTKNKENKKKKQKQK